MILSKGPRKARLLPLCGLKTLAAIIYLYGQICFPIWKRKKYTMEKIYIYSSGFWWETKQTPITSSRFPIPSQVQPKDTKLPRADNMVELSKKIPWKDAIFYLYIDTPFSTFQLEFAFHNQNLFHIIMISLIKGMELFWQFYKDIWWKERAGIWK